MDRGLADPELLCRRADRGPVLYDVKGQLAGPFLDIPFHTATTPRILHLLYMYMRGRGFYEAGNASTGRISR